MGRAAIVAPIDEIDIYRSAKIIMALHGDGAVKEAIRRSNRLAGISDTEGAAVWKRIAAAIQEMQRTEPDGATH